MTDFSVKIIAYDEALTVKGVVSATGDVSIYGVFNWEMKPRPYTTSSIIDKVKAELNNNQ